MSAMVKSGVAKICAVCGDDVAQKQRFKNDVGEYFCRHCRDAQVSLTTSSVTVRIMCGGEVVVPGQTVGIGASPENHVVLPFNWVRPRHLVVRQDAGVVRVKTDDPLANAFIGREAIGTAGVMLPPGGRVIIPTPDGAALTLEFVFNGADKGAVLVDEGTQPDSAPAVAEIAGVSPLDEEGSLFNADSRSATASVSKVKKTPADMAILISVSLLIMFLLLYGALAWNQISRSRQSELVAKQVAELEQSIPQARELIKQGNFVEAKALIDEARRTAGGRTSFAEYVNVLDTFAARPEIKLGGVGYVLMDGQWLPPETARAWKSARDRDDPKIESLRDSAAAALAANRDMENARRSCEEALALMAAEPVHPHPLEEEVTGLRDDIKNNLVAAEMTAKGFVLYEKRWVTPQEQFRLEQIANGLAEYKGKWMSKGDAFSAEQTDKGLVLFQGRWMTPDEQKVAQGFVKFEDTWVKPEEKARILEERAQAARLEGERLERERIAAAQEAERQQKERVAIDAKMPDAYSMSQAFVRDILKSPASAQFQPYESPKVSVTYKDGWYTVMAVVDAQNGFGALLRSTYLCKLQPVGGDRWKAETTFLLDN